MGLTKILGSASASSDGIDSARDRFKWAALVYTSKTAGRTITVAPLGFVASAPIPATAVAFGGCINGAEETVREETAGCAGSICGVLAGAAATDVAGAAADAVVSKACVLVTLAFIGVVG